MTPVDYTALVKLSFKCGDTNYALGFKPEASQAFMQFLNGKLSPQDTVEYYTDFINSLTVKVNPKFMEYLTEAVEKCSGTGV